jgi:hypothetical protein
MLPLRVKRSAMQRTLLGILAAALLAGSVAIWAIAPAQSNLQQAVGVMLRLGLVFGAMWMAIPNFTVIFTRVPPWLVAATFVGFSVVAFRPRLIVVVAPILLLLWVIGPNWLAPRRK